MTSATGRTTFKHIVFNLGDSADTLRNIPISSLSAVGVTYGESDLTAWQDAVTGRLPNMPDAPIEISGPFDTSAAAASPALSGSHTVLSALNGLMVPRSLDIRFGIRATAEADSPQFGLTKTATSGYLVTNYIVDPSAGTYSARLVLFPGSALPAWGVTAETGA